nr:MAG TPA: hypothetical protein [Caudoviricetes sp.]
MQHGRPDGAGGIERVVILISIYTYGCIKYTKNQHDFYVLCQ